MFRYEYSTYDCDKGNKKFGKVAMFKKTCTLTAVSPKPLRLPPTVITPEQVIRHHRSQRRGGKGGQALSPPDLTYP